MFPARSAIRLFVLTLEKERHQFRDGPDDFLLVVKRDFLAQTGFGIPVRQSHQKLGKLHS